MDKARLRILVAGVIPVTIFMISFAYDQQLPISNVDNSATHVLLLSEENPLKITWTILDYYDKTDYVSIVEQERIIQKAFDNWAQYINAEAVFISHAKAADVFCTVEFKPLMKPQVIGSGGGDGKTWCTAYLNENKIFFVDTPPKYKVAYKLESHATHEIGHGLGLPHMSCGGCVMNTSVGDRIVPKPPEIAALQQLWEVSPVPPTEPEQQVPPTPEQQVPPTEPEPTFEELVEMVRDLEERMKKLEKLP